MANNVEIMANKNADKEIREALRRGLKKVGMIAETHAKSIAPVDTGLLRNSITFALGGEVTSTAEYMDNSGEQTGTYEGQAPADDKDEITLYVGTNVEYAPYLELGHMTVSGGMVEARPFLRPAMEDHAEEYGKIIRDELAKL
jgi:HK97 gp10 family phage protein